ncbi:MAG: hypothetical protein FJ146_07055 [Deltaproteobacteria bacterium]|nr:hypothetical protein [Deltaproteobacteria bacterium]
MLQIIKQATILGLVIPLSFVLHGCAVLHKAQLGDIDGRSSKNGTPISIKVSETTVDFGEAARIARNLGGSKSGANVLGNAASTYESYFQYGPRTGTPVFNELYARSVPNELAEKCPGGRITDMISIRETRAYPVVKGEIVRVDAVCIK